MRRRILALTAGLLTALVVLALIGLGTHVGRQALLGWVTQTIEDRAGVRLTARDFSLGIRRGVLELEGLTLSSSERDARPFVTVDRARIDFDWGELVGDRMRIESVRLDRAHVDFQAPLPKLRPGTTNETGSQHGVEVREILLIDGTINGQALPEISEIVGESWRASAVELRGFYRADRLTVEQMTAQVALDSRLRPTIAGTLAARLTLDAGGTFEVDSLEVAADGLSLAVRSAGDIGARAIRELHFELDADPARLVPDLTSSGHVKARGALALQSAALTGSLRVDVDRFPAELLLPALGALDLAALDPAGSWLDVDADLDLALVLSADAGRHREEDVLRGNAALQWRNPDERLVTADVRAVPQAPSSSFVLAFDAELLPDDPGRRHATALLTAPSWLDIGDGELSDARLSVSLSNLEDAARRLGIADSGIGVWRPAGEVSATAEAAGPLRNPRLELTGRWSLDGSPLVELAAGTRLFDPGRPFGLTFDLSLLPRSAGRRHATGEIHAPSWNELVDGELADTRIVVDLPDVAAAITELEGLSQELFPSMQWNQHIPETEWLAGALRAEVELSGNVKHPWTNASASWSPADGETVRLAIDGRVGAGYPLLDGHARLDVERVDVERFSVGDPGTVGVRGAVDATLELDGSSEGIRIDWTTNGRDLYWGDLALGQFRGGASFESWPPTAARLELEWTDPIEGVERVGIFARLDRGTLYIDPVDFTVGGHPATLHAALPLGSLSPRLAAWFGPTDQQGLRLEFDDLELAPLISLAGLEEDFPLRGKLDGELNLDIANLPASSGVLEIEGLIFDSADGVLESDATLRLHFDQGRLVLERTRVDASGSLIGGRTPLEIFGAAELNQDWNPEQGLGGLIRELGVELSGSVDAQLLKRFVAADSTAGQVLVEAMAHGPLDNLTAEVRVRGPDARLTYHSPYPATLAAPDIQLRVADGKVRLARATARLNDGLLELRGELDTATGEARLEADVDEARFRLDYGLIAVLGGNLTFTWAGDRGRLAGAIVLDRGVLRRDLLIDREVLRMLADTSLAGSDSPLRDKIDLDLSLDTAEGVSIKNNVADLRADWGRLEIGGTVSNPLIDGRIDVAPGGWLWIFGTTWRLEEAGLVWSGEPVANGRVIFEATSSTEDPSLLRKSRGFWHTGLGDQGPGRGGSLDFWGQAGQEDEATPDFMTYYQNRLVGALGPAVSTDVSFEPLPLLGETDNQARFTVAQQLSPNLTFIASTNPRDAEAQTYIVDMQGIPPFRDIRTQLFTNDDGNQGITVQQSLLLGGAARSETAGRRLGTTTVDVPEGVSVRRVKRATGYRKGDSLPQGAGLDVEVDVTDWMGRKGYPEARVEAVVQPVNDEHLDLHVSIDPGSHVRHRFDGEKLPRSARREIAALYRPEEMGAPESIDAVRRRTVEVLRGLGYPDPEVQVEVETDDAGQVLRVSSHGRKIEPEPPRIEGVPEEDATRIAARYVSLQSRVELAVGLATADRRLLRALSRLGWPEASLQSRELSDDGQHLTVRVVPGQRQHVSSIVIAGVDPDEAEQLAGAVQVTAGGPADFERIVLSSRALEDDLRDRGYADARVDTVVQPVISSDPFELAVRFEIRPGSSYRVADVQYEGLHASNSSWVERTAALQPGELLRAEDIAEARRRLYQTGVFKRIVVDTSAEEDAAAGDVNGTAEESPALIAETKDATVTFELDESPRFQLAYGGRWESDRGLSVVVDFVNTNSLGRGQTSGVRVNYGEEQKRLRFYHMIPNVLGPKRTLELFLEGRDDVDEVAEIQGIESWAQLTFPVARHLQMRTYAVVENREVTPVDPAIPVDDLVLSPRLGWQAIYSTFESGLGVRRRRGVFVGLDVSGAAEELGSDVTGIAAFSQFKWFIPVRSLTWAQSWRTGLLEARDNEFPVVDRLRAGGEFSVRGYPTNSLGPRIDGVPVGGELLFVVNQEMHRRLWRDLRGLVFFDAGNVWTSRDTRDSELLRSAGLGFRYTSPVGPLRLDVAWPLDRREGDSEYEVYFGFGTVF